MWGLSLGLKVWGLSLGSKVWGLSLGFKVYKGLSKGSEFRVENSPSKTNEFVLWGSKSLELWVRKKALNYRAQIMTLKEPRTKLLEETLEGTVGDHFA